VREISDRHVNGGQGQNRTADTAIFCIQGASSDPILACLDGSTFQAYSECWQMIPTQPGSGRPLSLAVCLCATTQELHLLSADFAREHACPNLTSPGETVVWRPGVGWSSGWGWGVCVGARCRLKVNRVSGKGTLAGQGWAGRPGQNGCFIRPGSPLLTPPQIQSVVSLLDGLERGFVADQYQM